MTADDTLTNLPLVLQGGPVFASPSDKDDRKRTAQMAACALTVRELPRKSGQTRRTGTLAQHIRQLTENGPRWALLPVFPGICLTPVPDLLSHGGVNKGPNVRQEQQSC